MGIVSISVYLFWRLLSVRVFAQRSLIISFGPYLSFLDIAKNIIDFAAGTISTICIFLFVFGAFRYILGAALPENVEKGKEFMKNSLIGLAIILASYGIVRIVFWVLLS